MKEFELAIHNYIYRSTVIDSCIAGASWIDARFLGLFAAREINENEIVCKYFGKVLTTKEALSLTDKSYLMRLGEQCYVDSLNSPHCAARFINDCRNPAGYNVKFVKLPSEKCALVVATRDIHHGEELFADYGKWYWAGCEIQAKRLSFGELLSFKNKLKQQT